MPQSLVRNYVHIVFSTKHRQPTIDKGIAPELYSYMGGVAKNLECKLISAGGIEDHIHLLCRVTQKIALMTFVQKVKANSSRWMKYQGEAYENFFWQNGYGAFSVSQSGLERVMKYIDNQEEHHKKRDFKSEYRGLLDKHEIPYDERYMWD